MRDNLKLLFSDNLIKVCISLSLVLTLIQTVLIFIFVSRFPPLIPFLNSQPWGVARLAPAGAVLILPAFLIGILLLNNFLGAAFYKRNTLIARLLSFNSLLFVLLTLLAFIQIIFLEF